MARVTDYQLLKEINDTANRLEAKIEGFAKDLNLKHETHEKRISALENLAGKAILIWGMVAVLLQAAFAYFWNKITNS